MRCTWDEDDPARSRALSRLSDWRNVGADEDVSGILAMSGDESALDDNAEDDDDSSDSDSGAEQGPANKRKSKADLRRLMGLGDSDSGSDASGDGGGLSEAEGSSGEEEAYSFVAGSKGGAALAARLAERKAIKGGAREETPWEKLQRKQAEKKKERRAARKARLKSGNAAGQSGDGDSDSDGSDGVRNATDAEFFVSAQGGGSDGEEVDAEEKVETSVFVSGKTGKKGDKGFATHPGGGLGGGGGFTDDENDDENDDDAEEAARNYDMRAVVRAERMAAKKLKGKRARKEAARAADAGLRFVSQKGGAAAYGTTALGSGSGRKARAGAVVEEGFFEVDVADARFAKVLDGGGDGRFGLDPTAPAFKQTPGMRKVLEEQRRRRRERSDEAERQLLASDGHAPGLVGSGAGRGGSSSSSGGGAGSDMSALVSSLKRRALALSGGQSSSKPKKIKKSEKKAKA